MYARGRKLVFTVFGILSLFAFLLSCRGIVDPGSSAPSATTIDAKPADDTKYTGIYKGVIASSGDSGTLLADINSNGSSNVKLYLELNGTTTTIDGQDTTAKAIDPRDSAPKAGIDEYCFTFTDGTIDFTLYISATGVPNLVKSALKKSGVAIGVLVQKEKSSAAVVAYEGSFEDSSGSATGTWNFLVSDGTITGCYHYLGFKSFAGTVNGSALTVSSEQMNATGTLAASTASGTWEYGTAVSGTWKGSRKRAGAAPSTSGGGTSGTTWGFGGSSGGGTTTTTVSTTTTTTLSSTTTTVSQTQAVSGFAASQGTSLYGIDFSWNAVAGASKYYILKSSASDGSYTEAFNVATTSSSRIFGPNRSYYFKIKSYKDSTYGPLSAPVQGSTAVSSAGGSITGSGTATSSTPLIQSGKYYEFGGNAYSDSGQKYVRMVTTSAGKIQWYIEPTGATPQIPGHLENNVKNSTGVTVTSTLGTSAVYADGALIPTSVLIGETSTVTAGTYYIDIAVLYAGTYRVHFFLAPSDSGIPSGGSTTTTTTTTTIATGTGSGAHYTISVFAGSGERGFADGSGSSARFNKPAGLAVDASGYLYVADSDNCRIRRIGPDGTVSTFAGTGVVGYKDGAAAIAKFSIPDAVAIGNDGAMYVGDDNNFCLRKIAGGVVSTLAGYDYGNADGSGTAASFADLEFIAIDSQRAIFVSDTENYSIRKVTAGGAVTTFVGIAAFKFDGINYRPGGLAVDSSGNLFVAVGPYVLKVDPTGLVSKFVGHERPADSVDGTGSAAGVSGALYLAIDAADNLYLIQANKKIRKITPSAVVSTMAIDNSAAALLTSPAGITIDASGCLYLSDGAEDRIVKLTPVH